MLIPGLLIALIVVVLVTSLAREARGAAAIPRADTNVAGVVCTITDPRLVELSGLALSRTHADLAYTINDSGNAPVVYALKVSTGDVVGTTRIRGGNLVDTEALSIDSAGTLWIADTGDNNNRRRDAALYALPEPGAGDHTVVATRYPITYPDSQPNVETLLINPASDEKFLVTKGLLAGAVFRLPATLRTSRTNTPSAVDASVAAMATDGAITPDGRFAIIRNYGTMSVYDAATWQLVRTDGLPKQPQGETLAVESGATSVLIGSEGVHSQLRRVALNLAPAAPSAEPARNDGTEAQRQSHWWAYAMSAAVALGLGALVIRTHR